MTPRWIQVVRIGLGVVVAGLVGGGVWLALDSLSPPQLLGLGLWLAGAVVVHDALLTPAGALALTGVSRAGQRLAPAARQVVVAGLAVGAMLGLVVVPQIIARAQGNDNPTVLPGDYASRLAWAWVAVSVVTLAGAAVAHRLATVRAS